MNSAHSESINALQASINEFLQRYGDEHSILDISELNGFYSAIGCAPEEIAIAQWMPAIWGGEQYIPEWQSENEINNFVSTFVSYYHLVVETLFSGSYQPLFSEKVLDTETDTIADEWCFGFLRGIQLWPPLNAEDSAFLDEALQPMRLFATEEGMDERENRSDKHMDYIQLIENNTREIFQHFTSQRMTVQRESQQSTKIGRNSPCPCGSGKKYKKCCSG